MDAATVLLDALSALSIAGCGYAASRRILSSDSTWREKYVFGLPFGCFIFLIPALAVGSLGNYLVPYLQLITVMGLSLTIVEISRSLKSGRVFLRKALSSSRPDCLRTIVIAAFVVYAVKVILVLLLRPINDGDAMYLWIPTGRLFYQYGTILGWDPYHFWTFTEAPGLPILVALTYAVSGDWSFRLLLSPFFLGIPLALGRLVRTWLDSERAELLTIVFVVLNPGMDALLYLYGLDPVVVCVQLMLTGLCSLGLYIKTSKPLYLRVTTLVLCLTLLFRYTYGLILAVILLSIICASVKLPRSLRLFALVTVVLLLVGSAWFGSLVHTGSNTVSVLVIALSAAALVVMLSRQEQKVSLRAFLRTATISAALILPAMMWALRCLLLGGSFLGIWLLRIDALTPAEIRAQEILSLMSYSQTGNYMSLLSPFAVLVVPWANSYACLTVAIALIFLARRNPAPNPGFIALLTMVFLYLTLYGALPTLRYLVPQILVVIGLFACSVTALEKRLPMLFHRGIVAAYCLTSVFESYTVQTCISGFGYPETLQGILAIVSPTYAGTYDLLGLVATDWPIYIIAILLAMPLLRFLTRNPKLPLPSHAQDARPGLRRPVVVATLASMLLFAGLVGPFLGLAWQVTDGRILELPEAGFFQKSASDAVHYIESLNVPEDVVLTFADDVASFEGLRVIDMYYRISTLYPVLDETNDTRVAEYLRGLGVRFLLLPGPKHWAQQDFHILVNETSFLKSLNESIYVMQLRDFGGVWIVSRLFDPSELETTFLDPETLFVRSSVTTSPGCEASVSLQLYGGRPALNIVFNHSTDSSGRVDFQLDRTIALGESDLVEALAVGNQYDTGMFLMLYDESGAWMRWPLSVSDDGARTQADLNNRCDNSSGFDSSEVNRVTVYSRADHSIVRSILLLQIRIIIRICQISGQ